MLLKAQWPSHDAYWMYNDFSWRSKLIYRRFLIWNKLHVLFTVKSSSRLCQKNIIFFFDYRFNYNTQFILYLYVSSKMVKFQHEHVNANVTHMSSHNIPYNRWCNSVLSYLVSSRFLSLKPSHLFYFCGLLLSNNQGVTFHRLRAI